MHVTATGDCGNDDSDDARNTDDNFGSLTQTLNSDYNLIIKNVKCCQTKFKANEITIF